MVTRKVTNQTRLEASKLRKQMTSNILDTTAKKMAKINALEITDEMK